MGSSRANVTLCPICRGNNSPVFIIRLDGASAVWWNDHSAPRAVFQWGSVCCFIVTFWPMMRHSVRVVCSLKCSISLHLHFAASSAPHVFSHSFLTPASLLSLFSSVFPFRRCSSFCYLSWLSCWAEKRWSPLTIMRNGWEPWLSIRTDPGTDSEMWVALRNTTSSQKRRFN